MTDKWTNLYAGRTQGMQGSAIREILKVTQQPDIISFAGGLPAPELFPVERMIEANRRVLEKQGSMALQYSPTEGYNPLREMVVEQLRKDGVACSIDNVLITSGSQQALDLLGKVLLDPGDYVIVEDPTYLGALQAWNAYEAQYAAVLTDNEGMVPDALKKTINQNNAKFIYALPNFQNPSGVTLSRERRQEIVRLVDDCDLPIIEDDPYGQLFYEGEPEPSLLAVDAHSGAEPGDICDIRGNVIYLSTFSKTLCPGLRVAWMVGPKDVIARITHAKQGVDLHTSTFTQMVAYETARDGFLEEHVEMLRSVYRERRDLMLGMMDELFPPGVTWTHPRGGLFLWVQLPEGIDAGELLKKAVEQKVAFVPGSPFFSRGGGENTLRMNFSNARPEQIEEGMKRLAAVLREAML
jgi:2-aminoadipate transaminase